MHNQSHQFDTGFNGLAESRRFRAPFEASPERDGVDPAHADYEREHSVSAPTWINGLAGYLPSQILTTRQLAEKSKKPVAWYTERTGIKERRRAGPGETAETMALQAVRALETQIVHSLATCDLIIGATYTPSDTIATIAHVVQKACSIENARVFQVSAACTSVLVAIETATAYLKSGMASRVLIAAAEHNSRYCDDSDEQSGHLWGDAAAAMILSSAPGATPGFEILDVSTRGLAQQGYGPNGIFLDPKQGGLQMPHGKDVFAQACIAMEKASRAMLHKHGLLPSELRLLVPHQANLRIVEHVAMRLGVDSARCATTVDTLGNTGCVSPLVSLLPHERFLVANDLVLLVAFGGGYSVGAALLRRS